MGTGTGATLIHLRGHTMFVGLEEWRRPLLKLQVSPGCMDFQRNSSWTRLGSVAFFGTSMLTSDPPGAAWFIKQDPWWARMGRWNESVRNEHCPNMCCRHRQERVCCVAVPLCARVPEHA